MEPRGPLVDGVEQVGVDFVVPGNRTLVYLNLSCKSQTVEDDVVRVMCLKQAK